MSEPDSFEDRVSFSEKDEIIHKVRTGELTPEKAEKEAAERGLGPIEQKPEERDYDPHLKVYWTVLMALAWISKGDINEVRRQWPEYRERKISWHIVDWIGPQGTKYKWSLEPAPPTRLLNYVTLGTEEETTKRLEAKFLLWRALQEGGLTAIGTDSQGSRKEIPSYLWASLESMTSERGPDRYRSGNSSDRFDHVEVLSSAVKSLWPRNGESNQKDLMSSGGGTEEEEEDGTSSFDFTPRPPHRPREKRDAVIAVLKTFTGEQLSAKRESLLAEVNALLPKQLRASPETLLRALKDLSAEHRKSF
jgi:hypothetical protein